MLCPNLHQNLLPRNENFTDRMTLSRVHRHIRCSRKWMLLPMWTCLTCATILQLLWKVNNLFLAAAVFFVKLCDNILAWTHGFDILKMSWNFTIFLSWKNKVAVLRLHTVQQTKPCNNIGHSICTRYVNTLYKLIFTYLLTQYIWFANMYITNT